MSAKTRIHENRRIVIAGTLIAIIALAAVCIGSALGGSLNPDDSDVFVVVTGSMDGEETEWPISTIPVNSLVVVKTLDRDELSGVNVGDVIAFDWGGMTVVHRVVSVDPEGETFTTHGDANSPSQIETVSFDKVSGVVIHVYPTIGKFVMLMRNNLVLSIAGIIALVIAAYTVLEIYRIVTNKEEK